MELPMLDFSARLLLTTDNFQQLLLRGRDLLRPLVPKRWRGLPLVPVVRLTGVIGFSTPLKPGLTLAGFARALDRAFGMGKPKAVALVINTPIAANTNIVVGSAMV